MLSAFELKGLSHGRYMLDSHYSYWKMKRLVFILLSLEGEGRQLEKLIKEMCYYMHII